MLLHGIMSSIAEFYSRNLAAEVTKGLTTKGAARRHRQQGTHRIPEPPHHRRPGPRAAHRHPRRGTRTVCEGRLRPVRHRRLDRPALADWLAERGFTTVPTPKVPSKPMSEKYLHRVLTNPYYRGSSPTRASSTTGVTNGSSATRPGSRSRASSTATTTATASASTTTTSRTACGAGSAASGCS
jgi:site-specific DNA recombinase